jgi:hypothetical protein
VEEIPLSHVAVESLPGRKSGSPLDAVIVIAGGGSGSVLAAVLRGNTIVVICSPDGEAAAART